MVSYDFAWLKSKGFFKKTILLDIEKKRVIIDDECLLAYAEFSSREELDRIRKELAFTKVLYAWFYSPDNGKVRVFRRFGEIKWFYYTPEARGDYLKSRLDKLSRFARENISILFDTKDIVNGFYDQLWDIRRTMARSVTQLKGITNKLIVVQSLINRLIFFYFMSQLGLVKVESKNGSGNKPWVLNRENTREFFRWICDALNDEELQSFLNKTFFSALGKVSDSGWSYLSFRAGDDEFSLCAPSLNGGLFIEQEIGDIPEGDIKIKGIRNLILTVLNRYNWIIGEELPDEEDVIGDLTPEIIGHIYEKFIISLEQIGLGKINPDDVKSIKGELRFGRKKIGAYYTPEEITKHISTNTIYPYITERLKERFGDEYVRAWNRLLGRNGEEEVETSNDVVVNHLFFNVLQTLKICDNTCGSGSFLIAAGEVLLDLYKRVFRVLEESSAEKKDVKALLDEVHLSSSKDYYIVKNIITNNLYGVDIAEGAIEIAKLRFWLWLISQVKKGEPRIEPLPNLDFNLMTGNSLIGFIQPEEIEIGEGTFLEPVTSKGQARLIEKTRQLGFVTGQSLTQIMKEIGQLKKQFKLEYSEEKRKRLRKEIETKSNPLREKLNEKLLDRLERDGREISGSDLAKLKPFHWGFEFYEIFDLDKPKEERGFSIIVGNPPYVKEYTNRQIFEDVKKASPSAAAYYEGKMDYLFFFIEVGVDLLRKKGFLSFITTNYWLQAEGGRILREKMLSETTIISVFDFNEFTVFEGTGQHNLVFVLHKERNLDGRIRVSRVEKRDLEKSEIIQALHTEDTCNGVSRFLSQPQKEYLQNEDFKISFLSGPMENICKKVKTKQNYLFKEKDVATGIDVHQDRVLASHLSETPGLRIGEGIFVVSSPELRSLRLSKQEQTLIKPFYTTENLGRYLALRHTDDWIIYTNTETIKNMRRFPKIKAHLDRFKKIITSDFGPYGLHRAREERFFLGEKIVSLRKTRQPAFTYVDFPCYVSLTFFIIKPKDINLKYLTAILNSKLMHFWLYHKGKKEGNQLQIDKAPILTMPIRVVPQYEQLPLIKLVDEMHFLQRELRKLGKKTGAARTKIEAAIRGIDAKIDEQVYEIYGITGEEKKTISDNIESMIQPD